MLDDFPIGTLTTRHRNGVDAQRDDRAGVDRLGAEGVEFVPTGIAHVWLDLFHVLDCSVERCLGGSGVDLLVTVDVDGQALFELVCQRCFDEGGEQRVRACRATLELRVCWVATKNGCCSRGYSTNSTRWPSGEVPLNCKPDLAIRSR